MPYKTEKEKLGNKILKRSSKLLDCQKEMILFWRNKGCTQRELAGMFNVSRRLITFVLDPSKLSDNIKRRAERGGGKIYYDKEKHKEYIKTHRKYKHNLLK